MPKCQKKFLKITFWVQIWSRKLHDWNSGR